MRTQPCQCGQTLFFDNTICMRCGAAVGRCAVCRRVTSLGGGDAGDPLRCQHPDCRAELKLCRNYESLGVCNGTVSKDFADVYCSACQLTDVIPPLEDAELRRRWSEAERAKTRVLDTLDLLKLPYRRDDPDAAPPLVFHFLTETETADPVVTGHLNGRITINLKEADSVERETSRVAFNEPQRTLVGHFRHELGHYYWDVLIKGRDEERFRSVFGDERSPSYDEARQHYYANGPTPQWETQFVSAYASMHPCEDFAECFAQYLDIVSLLDTSHHHRLIDEVPEAFEEKVPIYQRLAIVFNEATRERGLLDQVPEILTPAVVEKLQYLHDLTGSVSEK